MMDRTTTSPRAFRLLIFAAACTLTPLLCSGLHAQATPASSAAEPTFTLRANTNLVVLDVVVTDSKGKPVHDLKASDFKLQENDAPEQIRSFQEHASARESSAPPAPLPGLAPGLFTNFQPAPRSGPVNILLLDTLNTPLRDQAFVRNQLLDYLKKAPANQQIGIFGLTDHLVILQGITSDPAILRNALLQKKALHASALLDDPTGGGGGDGAGATSVSDAVASLGYNPDTLQLLANIQQFEAQQQSAQVQVRAQLTLDALNQLARYLANIPGRKNLLWFSGSLPVSLLPNGDVNNAFAGQQSFQEEFRETSSLLARSQVAVYPIDARGVQNSPTYSVAASGTRYATNPQQAGKDDIKFSQQNAQENGTMQEVAEDTGGRAFFNTNALTDAVTEAINSGSNYYTLTYTPTEQMSDGQFRRISVSLGQSKDTLAYRKGYYAEDRNKLGRLDSKAQPADPAVKSAITRSMVRGAPVPTQILFTVRVLPASAATEDTLAKGNKLITTSAKGPYTRYAIDFAINPRDFRFTEDGTSFHDAVEFITFLYNAEGTLINTTGTTLHADFTAPVYQSFLRKPFSYNQDISVPTQGNYFLRIAVHDLNSDHVGAVEIPVATIKSLPALDSAR